MGRMIVDIPGTGPIDLNKVIRLLPDIQGWNFFRATTQQRYILGIIAAWPKLMACEINTPLRLGHFFGQGLIETGWLRYDVENLNYSAETLQKTFSVYRDNPGLARQHARKAELIAETVYGRRQDLGNTEPGDGWKFRGRGFIQLTGRANYTRFAELTRFDLVNDPDIIRRDLQKSVEAAAMFWQANGLNRFADTNDARSVSRAVNRGNPQARKAAHHEDLRILWTNKALELTLAPGIAAPDAPPPEPVSDAPSAPGAPSLKPLQVGSRGERVRQLQADLETLGFRTGGVDGIFGRGTRNALVAFQHEQGLPTHGVADGATLKALADELADPARARDAVFNRASARTFGGAR